MKYILYKFNENYFELIYFIYHNYLKNSLKSINNFYYFITINIIILYKYNEIYFI
jgi:hypothetical protein